MQLKDLTKKCQQRQIEIDAHSEVTNLESGTVMEISGSQQEINIVDHQGVENCLLIEHASF
jgi:hypothetical protein